MCERIIDMGFTQWREGALLRKGWASAASFEINYMEENKKEWDESEEVDLPQQTWDGVWSNINQTRRSSVRIARLKYFMAAASVIAIAIVGVRFYQHQSEKPVQVLAKAEAPLPQQKLQVNTSHEISRVMLPDSSEALLSPGAIVRYTVPFLNNKRDFVLEGEARFKVKPDKVMPFTVYGGELATTALGTEFTVNTNGKNATVVKLHSGKVVVRASDAVAASWKKDVYMQPGQQLTFNTHSMTVAISRIKSRKLASAKKVAADQDEQESNEMVFTNTPLSEVISKLERHYRYNIIYNHNEIADMNFTGSITKSDSLQIVLKVIAQMNNLEMIHENDRYELRRK